MSDPERLVSVTYYVVFIAIAIAVETAVQGPLGWWGSVPVSVAVLIALRVVWNRWAIPWLTGRLLARRAHS
jgi:hypothetical protein